MQTKHLLKKSAAVDIIFLFVAFNVLSVCASFAPADIPSVKSLMETKRADYLIWDNGGYHTPWGGSWPSQLDTQYPFNCQVADDFMFTGDMKITRIFWPGNFWGDRYENPTVFNIIFYADDGTGNMPTGVGMDDPTPTALAVYHLTGVNGTMVAPSDRLFEYNVTLPEPFYPAKDTKYWIAVQWVGTVSDYGQWGWRDNYQNPDQLHIAVRGFPFLYVPYWSDLDDANDMSFRLYGEWLPPPQADLSCSGSLSWTDVEPGATVYGSFQVINNGEPYSRLNWTVASYPDWGTWTFLPSSGTNLTPDDGPVTVNVEVVAPPDKEKSFNGTVRVVNTDNTSDFANISVTLTTPLNQGIHGQSFFTWFPRELPLIRHLFG
jgi:hypothetical protein